MEEDALDTVEAVVVVAVAAELLAKLSKKASESEALIVSLIVYIYI